MRTRGLKDDTTCIVVDIIPPDNSIQLAPPPKKQNKLRALLFRSKSKGSASKLSKKLSAVGIVEELFEEGSAMLAERFALFFTKSKVWYIKRDDFLSFFFEMSVLYGFSFDQWLPEHTFWIFFVI